MDLTMQDISCYLPINRSENIFVTNYPYKKADFQTLLLYSLLILCSIFYNQESCRLFFVTFLKLILCTILSVVIFPIIFVFLFVVAIYRQFIIVAKKIKLGNKYGGVLLGPEAIWTIEDPAAKSVINILMIVKTDENDLRFYNNVEQKILKMFFQTENQSLKILATHEAYAGYFFIKKNCVKPSDCIKRLHLAGKEIIEKDELMYEINKMSNAPLPQNHSAFWEVLIGTQNVKWNSNSHNYFPIVFRVHHALGDGISLLKILMGCLSGKAERAPMQVKASWWCIIKRYITKFLIFLQIPLFVCLQSARKDDANVLHGPALSGKKIFVAVNEVQRSRINIIKKIKQRLPRLRFADVLLVAISRSIQKYISKHSENGIPETVTSVVPALLEYELQNLNNGLKGFSNSFSVAMLDVPIIKGNKLNVKEYIRALTTVNKETTKLHSAVDYQINYWILNVVSKYLPALFLRPIIESSQSTMVISNLPGPTRTTIFDKYDVEDIVFWTPHRGSTGLGISILSYDGRLQIGLNVDSILIPNRESAQLIVDGVFEEIDQMGRVLFDT